MKRLVDVLVSVGFVCVAMLLGSGGALAHAEGAPAPPGGAGGSSSGQVGLGPVPAGVLAAVNAGSRQFVLSRSAHAPVSRERAIVDAINEAPWFGWATGASLVRTAAPAGGPRVGTLVWLVSLQPLARVGAAGGGPPTPGPPSAGPVSMPAAGRGGGRTANYFIVAISARNGRFRFAEDGFVRGLRPTPRRLCRAPALAGAPVRTAVIRASLAGCALRLLGATVTNPTVQTVERQSPVAGMPTPVLTLTVNPLCGASALSGPPAGEPLLTAGPTSIVTGLFVVGGPLRLYSSPHCAAPAAQPWPGSITITNADGTVAATEAVRRGQLATFALPPGTYTISGTFSSATVNDQPMRAMPVTITLPAGTTVRQDITADVP